MKSSRQGSDESSPGSAYVQLAFSNVAPLRPIRQTLGRRSFGLADEAVRTAHSAGAVLILPTSERDIFDNELLTDLTALYFGFGVFISNNTHKSTGELTYWPGTQLRRPEYLSEPMIGYALALIAWHRDELRPAWSKHLSWTPRSVFKAAMRYLEKTRDCSFLPVRFR